MKKTREFQEPPRKVPPRKVEQEAPPRKEEQKAPPRRRAIAAAVDDEETQTDDADDPGPGPGPSEPIGPVPARVPRCVEVLQSENPRIHVP